MAESAPWSAPLDPRGGHDDTLQLYPISAPPDQIRERLGWASPEHVRASSGHLRPELAKITVPTPVVHGDADPNVPLEPSARAIATLVPNSRLEVIAGTPHGLTIVHAEQLNALLLDLLNC